MNHEFCIKCGGRASYEISKPRFCPNCSLPFNTSLGVTPKRKEFEEEEEEYEPASFDIEKLRASIVSESSKHLTSLDDLWKDPAPKDPNSYRAPSSDPSGIEIIKQTMSECSKVKAAKEINA